MRPRSDALSARFEVTAPPLRQCAIGEIHLTGHAVRRPGSGAIFRIDDQSAQVDSADRALDAEAIARFGPVPTTHRLAQHERQLPAVVG